MGKLIFLNKVKATTERENCKDLLFEVIMMICQDLIEENYVDFDTELTELKDFIIAWFELQDIMA